MDTFLDYVKAFNLDSLIYGSIRIVIILILSWIGSRLVGKVINALKRGLIKRSQETDENALEAAKRIETITKLVRQAFYIIFWVIIALLIFNEVGIKIGPILASAGIVGLAVGFGAQNLVRDVISGFFIIMENQIRVGDVGIINGTGGLVEHINFRTIELRDLAGTVHIFPNGTITTLSNMTKGWSAYVFDLSVAYKEDIEAIIKIIEDVVEGMQKDPNFRDLILEAVEIFGVDKFDDSGVIIKGRIKTKPIQQWAVGREFLKRIKYEFDAHNIEIPFPHRSLYFGEISKPFAVSVNQESQKTNLS